MVDPGILIEISTPSAVVLALGFLAYPFSRAFARNVEAKNKLTAAFNRAAEKADATVTGQETSEDSHV